MPPKTRKQTKDEEKAVEKASASKKIQKPAKNSKDVAKVNLSKDKEAPKVQQKKSRNKPEVAKPTMKGYTDEQFQQFKKLVKENDAKYSVNELKSILQKNDQKTSGNKRELLERVADGELLGRIPRCMACFGGRLQFDSKKGVYKCPGYFEDATFIRCKAAYDSSFIQRDQWVE